jgi:hypothetical protein
VARVQEVISVKTAPLIPKHAGQERTILILAKKNVLLAWKVIIVQRTLQILVHTHVQKDIFVQTARKKNMNFHVQRDIIMTEQWPKVDQIAFHVHLVIIVINQVQQTHQQNVLLAGIVLVRHMLINQWT